MTQPDHYEELAEVLGFPGSERLVRILAMIMTQDEAFWLAQLPATPGQLAQRLNCTAAHARQNLEQLARKGYALPGEPTPTGVTFNGLGIGFLADFVLMDPRFEPLGEEFYDAWRGFFNQEQIPQLRDLKKRDAPPGFRVLPAESALPQEGAAAHDRVSWIVGQAEHIAVAQCPCRRRERRCDYRLEVCMFFDRIADHTIARGMARPISHDEALALLQQCSEEGLVHDTENVPVPRIICNCCPCCCVFLRPRVAYGLHLPVATSRYRSHIDPQLCTNCQLCLDRCSFGALEAGQTHPTVQADNCIGCGLCVIACPEGALSLQAVREQTEFAPSSPTVSVGM